MRNVTVTVWEPCDFLHLLLTVNMQTYHRSLVQANAILAIELEGCCKASARLELLGEHLSVLLVQFSGVLN